MAEIFEPYAPNKVTVIFGALFVKFTDIFNALHHSPYLPKNYTIMILTLNEGGFVEAISGQSVEFKKSNTEGVFINNVTITESVHLNKDIQFPKVTLGKNVTFEKNVYLKKGRFKSLHIDGAIFKNNFVIEGGYFEEKLELESGEFKKEVTISGGDFFKGMAISSFNGLSEKSKNRLYFYDETKPVSLEFITISGGDFHDSFNINGGIINSFLSIQGGTFHKGISLNRGEIKSFTVGGGTLESLSISTRMRFLPEIHVVGGSINSLWFSSGFNYQFWESTYLNIDIDFFEKIIVRVDLIKFVSLVGININELKIYGCFSGKLEIINCNVSDLSFSNFLNQGTVYISKLNAQRVYQTMEIAEHNDLLVPKKYKSSSKLEFMDSYLGSILFFSTGFSSFQSIVINNIDPGEIKIIGKFITDENLYTSEQSSSGTLSTKDPKILSNFFKALSFSMKNMGNTEDERFYRISYLEWHRKYLTSERWKLLTNRKKLSNLIVLSFNRASNDYGQNWIKSASITILISIICYNIYYMSIWGWWNYKFSGINGVWSSFFYHAGNYIQFLLPTHKFGFIENVELGALSNFIDGVSRIIIGIMIYQTVSSFRIYGKR